MIQRVEANETRFFGGVHIVTALEFQASLNPDGTVNVPRDMASQLKNVASFRVVLLVPDGADNDDEAWRRLGLTQFFQGYAESDSVYDDP